MSDTTTLEQVSETETRAKVFESLLRAWALQIAGEWSVDGAIPYSMAAWRKRYYGDAKQ